MNIIPGFGIYPKHFEIHGHERGLRKGLVLLCHLNAVSLSL